MQQCYMVVMEIDYEPSQVKGVFTSLSDAYDYYISELEEVSMDSCSLRLVCWEGTESKLMRHSHFPALTDCS